MWTGLCLVVACLSSTLGQDDRTELYSNASMSMEHLTDLLGLNELPMDRLLMVRHSFEQDAEDEDEDEMMVEEGPEEGSEEGHPEALALTGPRSRKRPQATRRGAEIEHPWDPSKKSSISSIFTTTITALAFIAFGAYLIALVVYAIRNQNQYNGVMQNTGTPLGGLVVYQTLGARPVIGRRRRRDAPGAAAGWGVVGGQWGQEDMYRALIMMAEGYAMYHTAAVRRK